MVAQVAVLRSTIVSDALTTTAPAPEAAPTPDFRARYRTARLIAVVTGLIGFVLAVATPFLPVKQTTATLNWPQSGVIGSIEAPLMAQVPIDLQASIPCRLVRDLPPGGGLLLGTAPPQGTGAPLNAMFVRVTESTVDVLDRNVVVASAPRSTVEAGECSAITITSNIDATTATVDGLTVDGRPVTGTLTGDLRPQVVGVFTELSGPAPSDLTLTSNLDTRFTSTPTVLKLSAMLLAVVLTLTSLVALHRLDGTDGRHSRRFFPPHWLRLRPVDGVVVGILALWHFVGANTADDGYLLTMARASEHSGYMANYFRWFGVPEAPFGW